MRVFIAAMLIKLAMAILPKEVRNTVRGLLMYHVPGALTEDEKSKVRSDVHGVSDRLTI